MTSSTSEESIKQLERAVQSGEESIARVEQCKSSEVEAEPNLGNFQLESSFSRERLEDLA